MVTRRFSGPLAFAAVMLLVSFAYADAQVAGEWGHGHMWNYGWGWMFFGPLMMIAVIAAVVAVVVLLVRWLGGGQTRRPGSTGRGALDILEERFARGEIDREEFDERKRALTE